MPPRKPKDLQAEFPQTIYVKKEDAGNDEEPYLINADTVEELAEIGEEIRVAVYRLDSIQTLITKTVLI
jgi:hypothetical protein